MSVPRISWILLKYSESISFWLLLIKGQITQDSRKHLTRIKPLKSHEPCWCIMENKMVGWVRGDGSVGNCTCLRKHEDWVCILSTYTKDHLCSCIPALQVHTWEPRWGLVPVSLDPGSQGNEVERVSMGNLASSSDLLRNTAWAHTPS